MERSYLYLLYVTLEVLQQDQDNLERTNLVDL